MSKAQKMLTLLLEANLPTLRVVDLATFDELKGALQKVFSDHLEDIQPYGFLIIECDKNLAVVVSKRPQDIYVQPQHNTKK